MMISAGSEMLVDPLNSQELASVTVKVYVPAAKFVGLLVVLLLLHKYVYGAVPPEAPRVAVPSLFPKQTAFVVATVDVSAVGSPTTPVAVAVQPLLSVTVTL